jgi:hypothetical protein
MKRLYYVTGTLDSVQNISRDLDVTGIDEGRMHVLGKESGQVIRAQLHATTIWEDTEIMHAGFLGALFGALGGFIIGSALVAMEPWGQQLALSVVVFSTLFCMCFGAWLGGIYGISSRNHHLQPYWKDVEDGNYLVMVDADTEVQARRVERMMEQRHREAREVGHEDGFSPFN